MATSAKKHRPTIIFDLGGVLLDIDYQKTLAAFANWKNFEAETFYGSSGELSFYADYEMGKISSGDLRDRFNSQYKLELSIDEFEGAWNALLGTFLKERVHWLQNIARKYRIFLLSNTNEIHMRKVRERFRQVDSSMEFDDLFEKAFYSFEIGKRKPDPSLFESIIKDHSLIREQTLFIDDSLQNIQGARSVGLLTHHLLNFDQLTQMEFG